MGSHAQAPPGIRMVASWKAGLASLVALAVLVAGCSAAPEATPAPPPAGDTGSGAPGSSAAPSPGGLANATANATRGPPVETLVSFQGATDLGACVFAAGQGRCENVMPGTNDFYELDFPGDPLHLTAEVTWSATAPAGGDLSVYLLVGDGDGWSYSSDTEPSAGGASPLAIDWDLTAYAGRQLALSFGSNEGQYVPMVGGASYELQAEFAFEGALTSVAPAAAP